MKTSINSVLFLSIILFFSCSQENSNKGTSQNEYIPKKTNTDIQDLTKYGMANFPKNVLGGLKVGAVAPDFQLKDENGKLVSLEHSLKDGPVLLVFYRADWCPYCTKHLAEFQDKIIDIKKKSNASVLAVSPQMPVYSKKLSEENGYNFPILYDEDHVVMKAYKVFFRVTKEYNEKIFNYKGDYIQTRNGDTNPYLPVPATYIIGQDQRIKYVHYDPNYKNRADIDAALNAISNK